MVSRAWLLGACWLLGCSQQYDGVEPALELDGYVLEGKYVYNRNFFHGNDIEGEPFVALCPAEQALVGLSVGVTAGRPSGVSLRCAEIDVWGNLGESSYGERFGAEADPATEEVLECAKGHAAVALTGNEDVPFAVSSNTPPTHPGIAVLGIQCANARTWIEGEATSFDDLGTSGVRWGTIPFADACIAGVFVPNGFYGRFSTRLEQISLSCMTQNEEALRLLRATVGRAGDTP